MKVFITLVSKIKENNKLKFIDEILAFYVLLFIIYLYLMYGDLSTAPKFIYNEF